MPGGFKLANTDSQGDVTGKQKTFSVLAATAEVIVSGDLVRVAGTANAQGVADVSIAPTATASTGVVMSVDPTISGEALSSTHHVASTLGTLKVNVDPNAVYEVDVANGPLLITEVGLNAPAVVTEATASGGLFPSVMMVNRTGAATTSTLPLHIVGLLEDSAGVLGNVALVRLNATTVAPGATGV
jgi:hypothetical protein